MSAHHEASNEKVLGVTEDAVLRPIGILMVVVAATWSLFGGMALESGTYGQPLAVLCLGGLGLLVATVGKPSESI